MKRGLFVLVTAAFVASLASTAMAATWYKVGDLGFSTTPSLTFDYKRIKLNSVAVDNGGNVYATACNGNNDGANAGGLSIYKTDGSRVDVNLNALGYQMAVTKLVKGGDGSIYALQNWREIGWSYNKGVNRILKIGSNGSVNEIWNAGAASDANQIAGMTVGTDGNLYWSMNGADGYWKYHMLWRYDVASGAIEEAPINTVNNGWSDGDRLLNLECVGSVGDEQKFAIVNSGSSNWSADPIGWNTNRAAGVSSNPGWGRDHATATAFGDGVLWTGARGGGNRLILSRWTFGADGMPTGSDMWHAQGADSDMGITWWTSGLAVDETGAAWMGFGAADSSNTLAGMRGKVWRYTAAGAPIDEGRPQSYSDIMALGYGNGGMYATVMDRNTGLYSLYTTVPEPGSLLALGTGLIGLLGIIRRRK